MFQKKHSMVKRKDAVKRGEKFMKGHCFYKACHSARVEESGMLRKSLKSAMESLLCMWQQSRFFL